jgi:predicted TIM-barrel fold metal-dependent hydrolase
VSRLPKAWGDDVLHVRWFEEREQEFWFFGDSPVKAAWQGATWGFEGRGSRGWNGAGPPGPAVEAEVHPAAYEVDSRVAVMDQLGVDVQVLYPNLAGFDWAPFVHHPNPELSAAHLSVYNDLQIEWIRRSPGRFVPMLVVPYWDLHRTLAEIERTADFGFGGIVFTAVPQEHGQPALSSRHWDPMWRVCEEAGLSVSFHSAGGDLRERSRINRMAGDEVTGAAAVIRGAAQCFLDNGKAVTDLLMSGILARFPTLQFVSVESGMGWVPFVLEYLDKTFVKNGASDSMPDFAGLMPSDYFRRQVSVNFFFERLTSFHADAIGVERLLWESDFPHDQSLHTLVQDALAGEFDELLSGQPTSVRDMILWDNADRLYGGALDKQVVEARS